MRFGWAMCIFALIAVGCESTVLPTPTAGPSISPTSPAVATDATTPTAVAYPLPYPIPFPPPRGTVPPPPTWTPSATATPTSLPTTVPRVQSVLPERLPSLPRDLLFISHRQLLRWNKSNKHIEQLASAVKAFDASRDGARIALSLYSSVDEDTIAVLDSSSLRLTVLAKVAAINPRGFSQDPTLAISPDGQWVAYIRNEMLPQNDSNPAPTSAPLPSRSQRIEGDIWITHAQRPEQASRVGHCDSVEVYESNQSACFNIVWSSDSNVLAWADVRGLWVMQIGQVPQLIKSHVNAGKRFEFWHPRRLSQSNRYVLALIGEYEGGEWGIVDSRTGQSMVIPETMIYGAPYAFAAWLRDERVFVLSGVRMWEASPPTAYIWSIRNSSALTVSNQLIMRISANANQVALAPVQLESGQLVFGLSNDSHTDYLERGLYRLDEKARKAHKLTGMPPRPVSQYERDTDVFWSPDGKGAIVLNFSATPQVLDAQGGWRVFTYTVYAPTDGSALYDITHIVGDDACCFVWLNK